MNVSRSDSTLRSFLPIYTFQMEMRNSLVVTPHEIDRITTPIRNSGKGALSPIRNSPTGKREISLFQKESPALDFGIEPISVAEVGVNGLSNDFWGALNL